MGPVQETSSQSKNSFRNQSHIARGENAKPSIFLK